MAKGAEVVSGMRGREANPDLSTEGPQNRLPSYMRAKSSGDRTKKPVVFQSLAPGLMLSLVRVEDRTDPLTGRVIPGRPIRVRFQNCVLSLDLDPGSQMFKQNKLIYDILLQHPKFGVGKSFWLAEDAKKLAEEARYEDMKAQAMADPAILGRLQKDLADLKGEEFPLPEATAAK